MRHHTGIPSFLFLFASYFLLANPAITLGQDNMTSREYMEWFQKKYLVGQGGGYTPEEIVSVQQAGEKGDYASVVRISSDLIKKDPSLFYSLPYANWVKSLAYVERARAKFILTKNSEEAMADETKAAELGNLQAAKDISRLMLEKYQSKQEAAGMHPDSQTLEECLRVGAELGDSESARFLGIELWPNSLSPLEKAYWSLVGIGATTDLSAEGWDRILHIEFERVGEREIERSIIQYSPLHGPTAAGPHGLPGRGVIASIFADASLRREYGFSYGRRAAKVRASETPSTLDLFKLQKAYADYVGHARAYLLVPGDRKFEDPTIISLSQREIGERLSPSDYVTVRCGPIAHIAAIYKIDRQAGTISFVDGLFEFWQPTHNACITRLTLTPHRFGGFLASVPLADVVPMIQGVITFRDRIVASAGTKQSPEYVTVEQLRKSEFSEFFGIRAVSEETVARGERIVRYMSGGFQDQIFLSVRTDSHYRVREAILTLNRKWVGIRRAANPFASDITKGFLAALTPSISAEQVRPLAQAIWENKGNTAEDGNERGDSRSSPDVVAGLRAYYGEIESWQVELAAGSLMFENATDSYSNPVLRIRIRTVIKDR